MRQYTLFINLPWVQRHKRCMALLTLATLFRFLQTGLRQKLLKCDWFQFHNIPSDTLCESHCQNWKLLSEPQNTWFQEEKCERPRFDILVLIFVILVEYNCSYTSIPLLSFNGLPHFAQTSVDETSALAPNSQAEHILRSSSPIDAGKWYSWEDNPPIFPVDPTTTYHKYRVQKYYSSL